MKTLEEAVLTCGIMRAADESTPISPDSLDAANMTDVGNEVARNEHIGIYLDGAYDAFLGGGKGILPEEFVVLIRMFGYSMIVAGIRIGVEMEKQEVLA